MIPRYELADMAALFTDEARLSRWLEIELLALEAWAALGVMPPEDAAAARRHAPVVDAAFVRAVDERERVTDHDVAAFVDVVAASVGEAGRWVHHGLTSSDVLDTALGAGVFDLSNESREVLFERWMAYHRAPAGTLEVRTGTGRYLRVTETKTAEHGTVSTIADVTDDVQRAEELRTARETAEAASAAKSEFLSSMSHELRTPLNAILGWASVLRTGRLDAGQSKKAFETIERNVKAQAQIISDLLDVSRIITGKLPLDIQTVELAPAVREAAEVIRPAAAKYDREQAVPWDVIKEARRQGLHGLDLLQKMATDSEGLFGVIYAEELHWGCAGIALAIQASSLAAAGIAMAPSEVVPLHDALKTADRLGYPLVAKPDIGVGAAATYKIHNEDELKKFFETKPPVDYLMEEFVRGQIVTFDFPQSTSGRV